MADLGTNSLLTRIPSVFDYKNIGTAAGTTTVSSYPCYLHLITITQRVASGKAIIYDSAGTSGTAIGTIVCGTQTYGDPPSTYIFDVRTKNALTVANDADLGLTVSFGK